IPKLRSAYSLAAFAVPETAEHAHPTFQGFGLKEVYHSRKCGLTSRRSLDGRTAHELPSWSPHHHFLSISSNRLGFSTRTAFFHVARCRAISCRPPARKRTMSEPSFCGSSFCVG